MKKVTIKDIASISGVSRGTVDRVINGRGNVASEVEKKILKIAKDLGYEKNILASTLASNKVYKLAIVCPDPVGDPFWALPRIGFSNALEMVKHYGIVVEYFDFDLFGKSSFMMQMENAIKSKPDIILTAPVFTQESMDFMEMAFAANIPFITFNTELNHPDVLCYIGQNSFNSGYLAGRLFNLTLGPDDEIIVFNLGHNLSNAQHYSDKLHGLKKYIDDHYANMISKVHLYEFDQFMDKEKLAAFWITVRANHPKAKGLFFTNSRAYRLIDVMDSSIENDYIIVGFDLLESNVAHLTNDKINFIINQNPIQQGFLGVINFVNHIILKKHILSSQYLPLDIIVKENLAFTQSGIPVNEFV